jgi:hypothetical protein
LTAKAGVLPLKTVSNVGTVTSVAGNNANGFTVGVTNPTSTPTITVGTSLTGLMVGNGTVATALPFPGGTTTFLRADGTFATPVAGTGTVTSVSVVSANGFAGTVATATSTPAITLTTSITGLLKGSGTAISAATAGTDYSAGTSALATGIVKTTTGTGALTVAVAGDFPTLNQNTTGTAASITGIETVLHGGTGLATLTANNLLVGAGTSNVTFIAPGTSGNVLTSNGSVWASTAPAGASGLVCLSVQTASNVASVDFTTLIDSTYDEYEIHFQEVVPAAGNVFQMLLSPNGGSTYDSSYSNTWTSQNSTTPAPASGGGATQTTIPITGSTAVSATGASGGATGKVILVNPAGTVANKSYRWDCAFRADTPSVWGGSIGRGYDGTGVSAINAVRFQFSSGNITSGIFRLYGVRKSP